MPLLEERDNAWHLMQDPGTMLGQGHLGKIGWSLEIYRVISFCIRTEDVIYLFL